MLLTDDELNAIQTMDRRTPFQIHGVSHGFFSVARHYGGANYNGAHYVYDPTTDILTRADVLKRVQTMRRAKRTKKAKPGDLF